MKKIGFLLLSVLLFSCSQEDDVADTSIGSDNFLNEFVTLKSGVVVEKHGENYTLGGDMILTPEQLKALDETGSSREKFLVNYRLI